ncbi:hypothetical protein [Roseospira visakhapatnamensis]|uniref:SHOCT domain-containing protein n=1 Tax=Roseospira visakhapatnamensis TaxID=390880 RepID=A0A7W6RCH1_9PROT|nr:hypothetical protein [Roseospira visakhapatnamensis]MBB4265961.1 hypothetical protein [Roseospira visakhapatnamensis]
MLVLSGALWIGLSGCAAITTGTTQSMVVGTTPRDGARCSMTNEKGSWTVAKTPGASTVTRAYGDLVITCTHPDGSTGKTSVQSGTKGAAFGNIIAGGIIGAAVDMSSGAAYQYPSNITVSLGDPRIRPGTAAAPSPSRGADSLPTTGLSTPAAVVETRRVSAEDRLSRDEVGTRLQKLRSLKEQGLIPENEYRIQVRALLDRMQ